MSAGLDEAGMQRAKEFFDRSSAPKLTDTECIELYNEWASEYDIGIDVHYPYTTVVIDKVAERVADFLKKDKNQRVLDIGAGTGLLGLKMAKCGLTNIDALDMNAEMLKVAKKKKVPTDIIVEKLGDKLTLEDNSYDMIVGTGLFDLTHATPDCFPELIRVLKPGGTFLGIVGIKWTEDVNPYLTHFEAEVEEYAKSGKWVLDKKETLPHYAGKWDGVMFFCRKK